NIPIGILGVIMAYYAMPNFKRETGFFDIIGFLFFSGALILITLALEMGNEEDGNTLYIAAAVLVAAACIFFYIQHAKRSKNPLINLDLFKIRTLKIGLIGSLSTRLGIGGFPLLLPLMLQVGFGYSATVSGMMFIPSSSAHLLY